MTVFNPNADTIREEIFSVAKNDNQGAIFLTDYYGSTLDGSDVAAYMEKLGFEVTDYHDTGRCGLVTLSNGVQISTNGCCLRAKSHWVVEINSKGNTFKHNVFERTRHDAECRAINDHMHIHGYMDEIQLAGTYEV